MYLSNGNNEITKNLNLHNLGARNTNSCEHKFFLNGCKITNNIYIVEHATLYLCLNIQVIYEKETTVRDILYI